MSVFIRTNGRGNAWPVPLGKEHPFYDKDNFEDLANASFSIIQSPDKTTIERELLIDAGHGAIHYLIKHGNRIPDAIFLTHPHIDHTLSIDWVVQSHWRQKGKKYSVYASPLCWEQTLKSFPQIEHMVEFKALLPAKTVQVAEFEGMQLRFYPVFHGESAAGAGMLLFEYRNKKILFTGDILLPLLRKADYSYLQNCDVVYTDANNRYPYPNSNHWSVLRPDLINEPPSKYLNDWLKSKGNKLNWLIRPNLPVKFNKTVHGYFNQFLSESYSGHELSLSVFDFVRKINAKKAFLVHYSGAEDYKYYEKNILNTQKLASFANEKALQIDLNTEFVVPKVGNLEHVY
ncbi:MAG: MBL fold metallo-hydrolase [Bacteroidales bacterium]|nr:MBL fold metallo-hydrolase [Bacteroidales bacterium]